MSPKDSENVDKKRGFAATAAVIFDIALFPVWNEPASSLLCINPRDTQIKHKLEHFPSIKDAMLKTTTPTSAISWISSHTKPPLITRESNIRTTDAKLVQADRTESRSMCVRGKLQLVGYLIEVKDQCTDQTR